MQWYGWGPTHLSCHLCHTCWCYWKKYGGLKIASRLADGDIDAAKKKPAPVISAPPTAGTPIVINDVDTNNDANDLTNRSPHKCSIVNCEKEFKVKSHLARHYAQAHGIAIRSGSPRPIMKTRTAFYLQTTGATKLSRRLCRHIIRIKKAARQPSYAVNLQAVKVECEFIRSPNFKFADNYFFLNKFYVSISDANAVLGKSPSEILKLLSYRKKNRGKVTNIANRLGNPEPIEGDWLVLTPKDKMPQPEKVAFPKPPKAADGSLLYERVPCKGEVEKLPLLNAASPASLKRRHFEEINGVIDASKCVYFIVGAF